MTNIECFVGIYIILSILLGVYTSRYIKSSKDFCLAGRNLPLVLCSSTMFSTWFGAETVVGASAEFLEHGLLGVIEDPFGTSFCFLLIGLFFARQIYKLNIITIVDLFKNKFGIVVEKISAILMILSYIGWIAAQLLAMAIIMKIVFSLPILYGTVLSASIVCLYTICGGMWSVSINDFIQTIVIIFGLVLISCYVYVYQDPISAINQNTSRDFFNFLPEYKIDSWIKYIVAWLTIGLGSIPQQDVFQRVMSARSERIAIYSSYISSLLYIVVGVLPLFIAVSFFYTDSSLQNLSYDQVLSQAIVRNTNDFIKIIFFGALLSAIMSSASGAILAPATILGENIIKPLYPHINDKFFLKILRFSVLLTVIVSLLYTIHSPNVYLLVAESSVISLVSLFVPLVWALYSSKNSAEGAILSMLLGPIVWLLGLYYGLAEASVLLGLFASGLGMVIGNKYKYSYSNLFIKN